MNTKLLFFIVACFCLITCKKEEDTDSNAEKLVIGVNSGLLINQYDTILIGGYNNLVYIDLDVNRDKNFDFRLTSEIWGSPGLGQHPRSTILALNSNCKLNGILKNDTSYIHKTVTNTKTNDNSVVIYNSTIYSCKKIASNDSITKVLGGQFKIVSKSMGEILSKSEFFKSDTCILIDDWYSNLTIPSIQNDTTVYNYKLFDFTCDSYPSDIIRYIGFKIIDSKSEKLGWLKVSICDIYKISIMESAIQK